MVNTSSTSSSYSYNFDNSYAGAAGASLKSITGNINTLYSYCTIVYSWILFKKCYYNYIIYSQDLILLCKDQFINFITGQHLIINSFDYFYC